MQERPLTMESSETNTLSFRKRINRTNLAYMAGILDGEGCITVDWVNSYGTRKPYPVVVVKMTSYDLLLWVQSIFGGYLYPVSPSRLISGNSRKPQWTWKLDMPSTTWFLRLMVPFLKIKHRQARLAMVLRHMNEVGKSLPKKTRIANEINRLNSGKMIESKPTAT